MRIPVLALCAVALFQAWKARALVQSHARGVALPPVAICLVGEARTLPCEALRENILHAMVVPVREQADVFVALKLESERFGAPACLVGNVESQLRTMVRQSFNPVDLKFRGRNDKLDGRTAGVPCYEMLVRRELFTRDGVPYQWVMHLRGDVGYAHSLPAYSSWPQLVPGEKLLFTDCCGSCGPSAPTASEELTLGVCKQSPSESTLGCAKDVWALMSRSVAHIYYQPNWTQAHVNSDAMRLKGKRCRSSVTECLLGCALHAQDVSIQLVSLSRELLHNSASKARVLRLADNTVISLGRATGPVAS
mmetsp:Transcript_16908/g.39736  ORF Transcript_16908/g.39736 Transcript_16908/m.39736 type:complete len:307 (+) Transcript_16908:47-967(+)